MGRRESLTEGIQSQQDIFVLVLYMSGDQEGYAPLNPKSEGNIGYNPLVETRKDIYLTSGEYQSV